MNDLNIGRLGIVVLAVGWIGLAMVCLLNQDFLLQWQPVPKDLPFRAPLAVVSATVLLACGLGLLHSKTRRLAALILTVDLLFWIMGLQLPVALPRGGHLGTWVPFCEACVLFSGAWTVLNGQRPGDLLPNFRFVADGGGTRWAQYVFAACCLLFGVSHFVYAKYTADMIPDWMPERLALAYITGACHFAAGLAMMFSVFAKWAARLEAAMMSGFVVIVHIPSVFYNPLPFYGPNPQVIWALLFIATSLSGSAWVIAASAKDRKSKGSDIETDALAVRL